MEDKKQKYVIEKLTDNLIKGIESTDAKDVPFLKAVKVEGGYLKNPVNYVTKYAYKGVNKLALPIGEYMTKKQIIDMKAKLKDNAKSYIICKVFTSCLVKIEYTDEKTGEVKQQLMKKLFYHPERYKDSKIIEDNIWTSKYGYEEVYNIEDIEDLKPVSKPYPDHILRKKASEWCNQDDENNPNIILTNIFIKKYLKATTLDTRAFFDDYNSYYNPATDEVYFKNKATFKSNCEYYEQVFHELAHSTGHASRLNRKLTTKTANAGQTEYSAEEIIAELASMYCLDENGLLTYKQLDNCLAYIKAYFKTDAFKRGLKENPKLLLQCVSNAYYASDYILGGYNRGRDNEN